MDWNTLRLGVVLTQFDDDGREFVVAYTSRSNNKMKAKYSSHEGECLGVVWVVSSFRYYLYSSPFTLITNNQPLKFHMESDWFTRKLAMWALILEEYDLDIIHKHGRVNQNADGLNRNTNSIPLGFVGMVMWIWRWYRNDMLLHTFVPY